MTLLRSSVALLEGFLFRLMILGPLHVCHSFSVSAFSRFVLLSMHFLFIPPALILSHSSLPSQIYQLSSPFTVGVRVIKGDCVLLWPPHT